jgi:hypothetical protein
MLKNDVRNFFKYLPEICDFHKEITIFTKKKAMLQYMLDIIDKCDFFLAYLTFFSILGPKN